MPRVGTSDGASHPFHYLSAVAHGFLDVAIPPLCSGCREFNERHPDLCEACARRLQITETPACLTCHTPWLEKHRPKVCCDFPLPLISCGHYSTPLREMILDFKFHGMTSLADVLVDKLMVVHPELVAQLDGTCLVPVPLHPSHERGRGYNQAELIAHVLSERCTVDVRNDIVTRTDKRKQQAKLALDQRAANVSGAFAIDTTSDQVGGKIAIVDDVVTSGATVREIAKILRAGGYKPIMVISIASNYLW